MGRITRLDLFSASGVVEGGCLTRPPRSPDPELVACFLDPNSLTCVARGGPWVRGTSH